MHARFVVLEVLAIGAANAAAAVTDDFGRDSGLWAHGGAAYRDQADGHVVLTNAGFGAWGQIWLQEPQRAPFVVSFRYRAGGGIVGGDGLVFLFHKSRDFAPTQPDYGGSLGFSRAPHASLSPVPGYGIEFDSVHNLAIYNDPSPHHIALIQDHAGNHLSSVDDLRVADDLWHQVVVHVNLNSVVVELDGQTVLSWNGMIDTTHGGLGFSAGTGSYTNWHRIDDFRLDVQPATQILDNGEPGTTAVGNWQVSAGVNPYGGQSLYARSGASYSFRLPLAAAGRYDVALWWTSFASRSTAVPIVIEHADGNSAVYVDQTRNGGMWNVVGTFAFNSVAAVRIVALGSASTCADAVAFIPRDVPPPPVAPPEIILDDGVPGTLAIGAWTVSGAPLPYGSQSVYSKQAEATYTFSCEIDQSGAYEVYAWWTAWPSRSAEVPIEVRHADGRTKTFVDQRRGGGQWNLIGQFHFSTFAVVQITSVGTASTCADAVRLVGVGVPPPTGHVVVDNGTAGTSATGTWLTSAAPNPYQGDSLYAKAAGAYSFSAPIVGAVNVYVWWTEWPSRSASVPVVIEHAGGRTTLSVDQTRNGGQWNLLGEFSFAGQARVTIVSAGGGFSTCADAVRFQP